jgi:pimeloyl-ACP methyl ester carboxylesterase
VIVERNDIKEIMYTYIMKLICIFSVCTVTGCITTSVNCDPVIEHPDDYVILIHGLTRSHKSMNRLKLKLRENGYNSISLDYPSRKLPIKELSEQYLHPAIERCRASGVQHIHFITHSLGGIIVRQYLSNHEMPELGRIVMLGPPNKGSEVVDRLGRFSFFKWLNGPAGMQLGASDLSLPNILPPLPAGTEVAVIAGSSSINLILSCFIPGDDDGKVAIEKTKLYNMTEFKIVKVSHPFLMKNRKVVDMAVSFIKTGSLEPYVVEPELK